MGQGRWVGVALLAASLVACSSGDDGGSSAAAPEDPSTTSTTGEPTETTGADEPDAPVVLAGAASRSVLPTVDGAWDYLDDAPGWTSGSLDPDDPGVFVPEFDVGEVDVGNGSSDGSWVHDDLRVTALALQREGEQVVLVTTDTYMHFALDADAMAELARDDLPEDWADAEIIISATHNHHGPDTAFSINKDWYDDAAGEVAAAIVEAAESVEPAVVRVASGRHTFGVTDGRDPLIVDPTLNVMLVEAAESDESIATVVQWASHPETTLGWTPPAGAAELERACRVKGWEGDDCTADGRYFTADYPGVLRERVQEERGGEVLYLNGAIGVQIGPGDAPVWDVPEGELVADGWTVPNGAEPVPGCQGDEEPLQCQNLARTEAIGRQLALAVTDLAEDASEVDVASLSVRTEEFFTELTNIGFRLLIADGDLGWQDGVLYTCKGEPSAETCEDDGGKVVDDPVLTPFTGSQIRVGDVLQTRLSHLDLGDVGFLFLPGELPPELVVGVPADFDEHPERYYLLPDLHAVGEEYDFPGYLLSLVDESTTFTVGLGGDELGYYVPLSEYRVSCLDAAMPEGVTCGDLAARGVIDDPLYVDGPSCGRISEDPRAFGSDSAGIAAACRYGQAIGRELGEPPDHYEETNAAGWQLVDDLWAAATELFGEDGTGRVNPDLQDVVPLPLFDS